MKKLLLCALLLLDCNTLCSNLEPTILNFPYNVDEDISEDSDDDTQVQYIYGAEDYNLFIIEIAHKGFLLNLDYNFGLYEILYSDNSTQYIEFLDDLEWEEYE